MTTKTPIIPEDMFAEMKRLGSRNYAEVGVPMLLVAEDLSTDMKRPVSDGDHQIAEAFEEAVTKVKAEKGALKAEDFASIIELIADRTFLDEPFSSIGEE